MQTKARGMKGPVADASPTTSPTQERTAGVTLAPAKPPDTMTDVASVLEPAGQTSPTKSVRKAMTKVPAAPASSAETSMRGSGSLAQLSALYRNGEDELWFSGGEVTFRMDAAA